MVTKSTERTIEIPHRTGPISARKVVSQGERLEIATGDDEVKLDALLLEGLSWQADRAALSDLLSWGDGFEQDALPVVGGTVDDEGVELSISNEYSHVVVSSVTTEAGRGLRIATPARGTSLNLGPDSLLDLVRVEDTFVFSTWFETPFGPEDTPVEGPL